MTWQRFRTTFLATTWALVLAVGPAGAQMRAPDMLVVTEWTREDMAELVALDKFAADPDADYAGMPNQGIARRLNRAMNASLEILLAVAEETRSRAAVLERVRGFLGTSRTLDLPEAENERILWCYGRACEILDVAVEREQLETWLHGST
jgi:hypothetical protein